MRKLAFLLIIALLTVAGAVSAQENESYTVQRGDTITGIANAFDVEVDAILIANNIIDPGRISVGQVLTIPSVSLSLPASHVVQAGETLNDIAIRYHTTVEALVLENALAQAGNLSIGQVINLPAVGGPATFPRSYRVEIGDTLRNIGERYGVTWEQLASFNNILTPNYIQAGIIITIPASDYVVPTPEPAFGTGGPVTQVVVASPRTAVNGFYTVRATDNMFAIASDFGVNVYTLAQVNGILNLNSIFAGQFLQIPGL